ncbi:unnamed protein product [Alternaria alternata]
MAFPMVIRRASTTSVITLLAASGVGLAVASKIRARNFSSGSNAPAFTWLTLAASEVVNRDTKRLRFALPSQQVSSGLALTSSLLVASLPKSCWLPVIRPYTPITSPDNPGVVDLLVKRYPGGKQSTHLHSLAVGEKLFVVAAIPGFSWKPNLTSHVILIAGGSGITPVFQLMQGILRNPEDKTSTTLILGSKDNDGLLLKSELDQVAKDYPARVKASYTVSHLIEGSTTREGHIDKEFLETILPHRDQENHVFVCGPPSMEMFLVGKRNTPGILEQLGFKKNYIHTF